MVNRPLEDRRPLGPFIDTEYSGETDKKEENDNDVIFNSMSDLPDSPMLRQYVDMIANKTGKDKVEVINSQPVEDYMKKLGVWDKVNNGRE